jgi:phosphonate transport system substrate-binding protein
MKSLRQLLAFVATLAFAAAAPAAPTFTFTAIPDQDESRLNERFGQVAAYLSRELGIETRYVPVKSYPAAVTAFRNNEVQLAWFGGFTGVQARRAVPGSQAIAQGVEDTRFHTYFIANAATGLKPSATFPPDIAGKSFTFGSKASTSGRLMPEYFLREQTKKTPEQLFTRVGFSGDHTKTLELVQSGAYEVGAMDYSVWQSELKEGKVDPAKVIVVWETPAFPDYQWTVRGDADATFGKGFTSKLQAALIAIKDPVLLGHFARSGFIKASNADYQPIEDVAKAIGLLD